MIKLLKLKLDAEIRPSTKSKNKNRHGMAEKYI